MVFSGCTTTATHMAVEKFWSGLAVLCGVPWPQIWPGVLKCPDQHPSHCAHGGDSHKMKQREGMNSIAAGGGGALADSEGALESMAAAEAGYTALG